MLRASKAHEITQIARETSTEELKEILTEVEAAALRGELSIYSKTPFKNPITRQQLRTLDYGVLDADQRGIMDGWYYKISW